MTDAVRIAASRAELAAHLEVRERIFVHEQGLFVETDRDPWDGSALHAVALARGTVIGAVRFYALDEAGLWKGDRLAVLPEARRTSTARDLVRFAVTTAASLGGSLMLAQIQTANVRFFGRLGWSSISEPFVYRGVPHQRMSIALPRAVPDTDERWGLGAALSGPTTPSGAPAPDPTAESTPHPR